MELYGTNNFNEIAKVRGFILGRKSKYTEEDLFAKALDKNYTIIYYDKEDNGRIIEKGRIKLRCNIHECDFETSIIDFMKNANNCPKCDAEYRSKSRSKSTIEEAEEICKEKGYTLLTDKISNCDDIIEYYCNIHKDYGVQTTSLYGLYKYENNCRLCKAPKGENHYNWKGGIADDRERDNDSYEYNRWRKSVYMRDSYTCQACGSTGVRLNAHHIKNYSSNEELRFEITNGITLCEKCHINGYEDSFHSIYTNYNNTEEQMQEYLDKYRLKHGLIKKSLDEIVKMDK